MATAKTAVFVIDTTTPPPGELGSEFYHILGNIDGNGPGSSTSVVAHASSLLLDIVISGTGFTYDQTGNLTGGTATSFTVEDASNGDAPLFHANFTTGVSIAAVRTAANAYEASGETNSTALDKIFSAYAYTFDGTKADSAHGVTFTSQKLNDSLTGGAGNDILNGGLGNDTVEGGLGNDILAGGGGINTVSYAHASTGVQVDLVAGTATGGADNDTISGFVNIIGSDADPGGILLSDFLQGDGKANVIFGGGGNDIVEGRGGADTLDGGSGIADMLRYAESASGVTIDIGKNTASGGDATGDKISNFEAISGSNFNDVLTGNAGANQIFGAGGDDVIEGGAGADFLYDSSGLGDTVSYSGSSAGVIVDLKLQDAGGVIGAQVVQAGDASGDTFAGFENLTGSTKDDILKGNAGANVILGGLGNDTITGGGGNDTLNGGANTESNTVDYSYLGAGSGVTLILGANGAATVTSGVAGDSDTVSNFRNVTGGAGNDVLTGNSSDNIIDSGLGNDTLDGGLGIDTLSFADATTHIEITLSADGSGIADGAAGHDIFTNFENFIGGAGNDYFGLSAYNKAAVVYAGAGDDGIYYGGIGTTVHGGDGNDYIHSVADSKGADTIFGDAGDDYILTYGGNDVLDGGAGVDTLDLSYLQAGQNVTATLGAANVVTKTTGVSGDADSIKNFENLTGGNGNDVLTGNADINHIDGAQGDDLIEGRGGADYLFEGGDQGDIVSYAHSPTGVYVDLLLQNSMTAQPLTFNNDGVTANGDAGGDFLFGFSNAIGSAFNDVLIATGGNPISGTIRAGLGNDVISGAIGMNVLDGGAGDDLIINGLPNHVVSDTDDLIGGIGNDTVSYAGATAGITVDLSHQFKADSKSNIVATAGAITATGDDAANGDRLSGFENVIGGDGNDTLTGDKNANALTGGIGNDAMNGGLGNDILKGGTGADTLTGGAGNDRLAYDSAGEGSDTIADFAVGLDKISILKSGFGGNLTSLGATLTDASYFTTGTTATTAGHGQFIFDTGAHQLFWDDDGTGGNAQQLIATFSNNAVLHATDFELK